MPPVPRLRPDGRCLREWGDACRGGRWAPSLARKTLALADRHPAIISEHQWARAQEALLAAKARPRRGGDNTMGDVGALLFGKLVDVAGDRLTHSETKARCKSYRYYVSNRILHGVADATGWRLPAEPLEEMLATHVAVHLAQSADRHGILAVPDA
jgi:site-specific DNA recombinase